MTEEFVSFRIIRQILDHIYGSDVEMTVKDFEAINNSFVKFGGSWEAVIKGSPSHINKLISTLADFVKVKNTLVELSVSKVKRDQTKTVDIKKKRLDQEKQRQVEKIFNDFEKIVTSVDSIHRSVVQNIDSLDEFHRVYSRDPVSRDLNLIQILAVNKFRKELGGIASLLKTISNTRKNRNRVSKVAVEDLMKNPKEQAW